MTVVSEIDTNKNTFVSYIFNKFDNTTSSSFSVINLIENNSSKLNVEFFQNKINMNTIVENKDNITENNELVNGKKKDYAKMIFIISLTFIKNIIM